MPTDFVEAIKRHQSAFGLDLSDDKIESLNVYYEFIQEHNPILHLVGKSSPGEFAVRHVLESIFMLSLTGETRTFADVGTGAGLPGIPCLLASEKLKGFLIESKEKKSKFLNEAVEKLGLESRCRVINRQFSEVPKPNAGVVVARALDKMVKKLPQLVEWSGNSTIVLFAGEAVRDELKRLKLKHDAVLIPMSERRFLFRLEKRVDRRR